MIISIVNWDYLSSVLSDFGLWRVTSSISNEFSSLHAVIISYYHQPCQTNAEKWYHLLTLNSVFPNTNRNLKTTKTAIKEVSMNISILLIEISYWRKVLDWNMRLLFMWRRPDGCIYIALLLMYLLMQFLRIFTENLCNIELSFSKSTFQSSFMYLC